MWGGGHPGAGQVVTWFYRGTAWHPRSFFVSVGGRLAQDEGPSAHRTEIWNLGRAPGGIANYPVPQQGFQCAKPPDAKTQSPWQLVGEPGDPVPFWNYAKLIQGVCVSHSY